MVSCLDQQTTCYGKLLKGILKLGTVWYSLSGLTKYFRDSLTEYFWDSLTKYFWDSLKCVFAEHKGLAVPGHNECGCHLVMLCGGETPSNNIPLQAVSVFTSSNVLSCP